MLRSVRSGQHVRGCNHVLLGDAKRGCGLGGVGFVHVRRHAKLRCCAVHADGVRSPRVERSTARRCNTGACANTHAGETMQVRHATRANTGDASPSAHLYEPSNTRSTHAGVVDGALRTGLRSSGSVVAEVTAMVVPPAMRTR